MCESVFTFLTPRKIFFIWNLCPQKHKFRSMAFGIQNCGDISFEKTPMNDFTKTINKLGVGKLFIQYIYKQYINKYQ